MFDNADSDDDEFNRIAVANFDKISSNVTKIGYTEGITEGSELAFQKGFDMGYEDGLKIGFEIAKYKSFVKEIKIKDVSHIQCEIEYFEKNLEDINPLNRDNLKFLSLNKNIEVITNKQNENFNNIVSNLKTNYPKINELF